MNLQKFNNPDFGEIRTVKINNEPWFVGKDVTEILGYTNPSKALSDHVEEEDKLNNESLSSLGQRGGWLINESGLYSLILSSKLPTAKAFKRWVTAEVLPSIRKHGAYMTPEQIENVLTNPDTIIQLAQNLKAEQEKRRLLESKVEEDKPKVIFADAVATAKTSILIGELAKILKQNGVDYNMPTQKSMELGLFEIKENAITHSDGHISVNRTPKVTGKGQQYFINLLMRQANG